MKKQSWIQAVLAAVAVAPALALAAPIGVFTIVEGEVAVIRDAERFAAVEGLRVRADDIVVTAEGARLVRVELDDGKAIDLGPATQVLLHPRALANSAERAATLYLGQGWVKLTAPAKTTAPAYLASARLDAARIAGTATVHTVKDEAWLFVESGALTTVPRRDGKAQAPQNLKEGDTYTQRGTAAGTVGGAPTAPQLAQMPRAFADTLPRRAQRYAGVNIEPPRAADVAYADVAPWLNGEAALRAAFVPRLTPRIKDARFRSALVAELKLHPEWQRVLFPPPPPKPPAHLASRPLDAPAPPGDGARPAPLAAPQPAAERNETAPLAVAPRRLNN